MKIFYTHQAIYDLTRLRSFIGQQNSSAADTSSQRIKQAINRLIEFPLLGKAVKQPKNQCSLRDLVTSAYVIRYAILNKEIHILRIWHGKEER